MGFGRRTGAMSELSISCLGSRIPRPGVALVTFLMVCCFVHSGRGGVQQSPVSKAVVPLRRTMYIGEDVDVLLTLPKRSERIARWRLYGDVRAVLAEGVLRESTSVVWARYRPRTAGKSVLVLVILDAGSSPVAAEQTEVEVLSSSWRDIVGTGFVPVVAAVLAVCGFAVQQRLLARRDRLRKSATYASYLVLLIQACVAKITQDDHNIALPDALMMPSPEWAAVVVMEPFAGITADLIEIVARWDAGLVEPQQMKDQLRTFTGRLREMTKRGSR